MITYKGSIATSVVFQGFDEEGALIAMPFLNINIEVQAEDIEDLKAKLGAYFTSNGVIGSAT